MFLSQRCPYLTPTLSENAARWETRDFTQLALLRRRVPDEFLRPRCVFLSTASEVDASTYGDQYCDIPYKTTTRGGAPRELLCSKTSPFGHARTKTFGRARRPTAHATHGKIVCGDRQLPLSCAARNRQNTALRRALHALPERVKILEEAPPNPAPINPAWMCRRSIGTTLDFSPERAITRSINEPNAPILRKYDVPQAPHLTAPAAPNHHAFRPDKERGGTRGAGSVRRTTLRQTGAHTHPHERGYKRTRECEKAQKEKST